MGLRVSGKRALIRITPAGGQPFDVSGVAADGRARANAFSFAIEGAVVDADGYNQLYTEPVPVGQSKASGSLTVFYANAVGEVNEFLATMRENHHEPGECEDVTPYTMEIMPEGECLTKERWTLEDTVLESLDFGVPLDGLLTISAPWRAGHVTRSRITAQWVAGGDGENGLAYSDDGLTWHGLGTDVLEGCYGIAYDGSGMWVAVGSGTSHTIAYSTDGIHWHGLGKTIFSTYGTNIAYDAVAGRWVATGSGVNTLAYSDDGLTWHGLGQTIFSMRGAGIAYNGSDLWVATGEGTNTLAYSADGASWTGLGTTIFDYSGAGVGYGNGRWVATGSGSANSLAYSDDGISWTGLGKTIFTNGYGAHYNGALWIAGGNGDNGLAHSINGAAWTGLGVDALELSETADYGGSLWVTVGARYVDGDPVAVIVSSPDGTTWTDRAGPEIFDYGYCVAFKG